MSVLSYYYFKKATISTDKTDSKNEYRFELIFDRKPARFLRIINDDAANSVYMILHDFTCDPGAEDIEIKAGEKWECPIAPGYTFTTSGIALVAATAAVIVRIEAYS